MGGGVIREGVRSSMIGDVNGRNCMVECLWEGVGVGGYVPIPGV